VCCLLDEEVIALYGSMCLVEELMVAALVHLGAMQGKEVGDEAEARVHLHAVLRSHPLEGLL